MVTVAGIVKGNDEDCIRVRFLEPVSAGSNLYCLQPEAAACLILVKDIVPADKISLMHVLPEIRTRGSQRCLKYRLGDEANRIYRNLGLVTEISA